MLPQEGRVLLKLRKQFAYYNNYCQADMLRQLDRKVSSYSTTFSALANNTQSLNAELTKGCHDLVAFLQKDKDELAQVDFMSELQQSLRIRGELERGKQEGGKEQQN